MSSETRLRIEPVPQPSTGRLLGMGLRVLAWRWRRKKPIRKKAGALVAPAFFIGQNWELEPAADESPAGQADTEEDKGRGFGDFGAGHDVNRRGQWGPRENLIQIRIVQ